MAKNIFAKPGMHDIPYTVYEADPSPSPSMRAGHAKLILTRSAAHAWAAHPRLNPDARPKHSAAFDLGIVAHAQLVGGDERIVVVAERDWRKASARDQRDEAYALGKTPVLESHMRRVADMTLAARKQLRDRGLEHVFTGAGLSERSIFYRDDGIWCSSRPDWHNSSGFVYDYKTTGCAAPDAWASVAFNTGCDVQAEMQCRAYESVYGARPEAFRWVVQEVDPPYLLSVVGMLPAAWSLAEMKVNHAVQVWKDCLTSRRWPGYPTQDCFIEQPAWHEAQVMEALGVEL